MHIFPLLLALVSSQNVRPDIASHPNWWLLDRGGDCGNSSSDRNIGGYNARLGQYLSVAHIGINDSYDEDNKTFWYCEGSIINERYVITAAHCSPGYQINVVQVRLGEYDMTSDPDCQDGVCAPPAQEINVEEYVCHTDYADFVHLNDDICLFRLAKPIQFNSHVQPICLPVYEKYASMRYDKTVLEEAKWGVIDAEDHTPILQTHNVSYIDLEKCRLSFLKREELTEKQLCAGGEKRKDACTRDSGAPLMASLSLDGPPRYFLVGITASNLATCQNQDPRVYTLVSAYMGWILENIRK